MEAMHRYLLHNGSVLPASSQCLTPGQVGLLSGWGIFSTIKIFEGVLFAFSKHYSRMRRDAEIFRVPFPWTAGELERQLLDLVEANQAYDATLRVAVVRNRGGYWEGPEIETDCDLIAFTTKTEGWPAGVRLAVAPFARYAASAFRGTKILSWCENLTRLEDAKKAGWDEVVLLNERGEVSECTSANVFAVYGDTVRTPPLDSGCLPGITREILLNEARVPGIDVVEAALTPAALEQADEVFITSTTRLLLPVVEIEGLHIRQGQRRREALQAEFVRYVNDYVEHAKAQRPVPTGG